MKVLMLTPYLPYPLVSGGQIRSYNLIKNLSGKHDITLFSFIRDEREREYVGELERYCHTVRVFKRRKAWSLINILLAGLTPMPFLLCLYFSPNFRRAVKKELRRTYDLIHVECFYLMHNLPRHRGPLLLVEQTIEYLVYQKFTQNFKWWLIKPFLYFDVLKLRLWESSFWRRASRLAAMSEKDADFIRKKTPMTQVDVVANGVDADYFSQLKKRVSKRPTVLFVGNFKWLPNVDAVDFTVNEIWPIIRKKLPRAVFWIVGFNPKPKILALNGRNGIVSGKKVDDIRQAFAQADVLLAPIRNGRGTKYKVLEAMATGTPVVGTPLGVEGLDVVAGKHALVGVSGVELAEMTIRVLEDKTLSKKLALNARRLIKTKYDWKSISRELERVYGEVAQIKTLVD